MWKHINWNNKIKLSAVGLFGLIILILVVINSKISTQVPDTITLDDVNLGVLMINAKGKPVFKEGKLIRLSEDKRSNLIITGTENNISEIDLSLNQLDKSLRKVEYGVTVISTLIKGAIPEWTGADAWLASAYESFSVTNKETSDKTIDIGNKTVKIAFNVESNSLYLNITKK